MKLVFTFDDGRVDSFDSASILKKFNLRGTFFVTTGFIDQSFKTDAFGKDRRPLTIEMLLKMKQDGHEIASHGDKHVTECDDFERSFGKMKQWGIVGKRVGFSVPNSAIDKNKLMEFFNHEKEKLLYIRTGRNSKCYSLVNKIRYALFRVSKSQNFYDKFNKENILFGIPKTLTFNSIVIKNYIKPKSIISFLDKFSKTDCICVLMFHSIVDNPSDAWEYSTKSFESICYFISKNNDIDVLTMKELVSS